MTTMFDDTYIKTPADIAVFLTNPLVAGLTTSGTQFERAEWIHDRLVRFRYLLSSKKDKSLIFRYLVRMTGLSRKQIGRHIAHLRK